MAAEQAEGVLAPEEGELKQPSKIAAELDATDKNLTDAPATLREDQVQNAVAFLAHPKVRGSSEESQKAFLERKGLTEAEIQEAFVRVANAATTAPGPSTAAAGLSAPTPRKPFPTGLPAQPVSYLVQQPPLPQQSTHWTQVVIGASVVAAGAYALKQLVGPYAARWYRKLYGIEEPPEPQDKVKSDQQTGELLANAISAQTKELREALEGLKEMMKRLEDGKQQSDAPTAGSLSVSDLRAELHAFAATLGSLDARPEGVSEVSEQLGELKSLLLSQSAATAVRATSKESATTVPDGQQSGALANGRHADAGPASSSSPESSTSPNAARKQSPSYQEVVEMLERGETPSNVRSDIDDKPPRPAMSPPSARMQPRKKPWEQKQRGNSSQPPAEDGTSEPGGSGVTITELEDSPPPPTPGRGSWKPPPVPQASLKPSPKNESRPKAVENGEEASKEAEEAEA